VIAGGAVAHWPHAGWWLTVLTAVIAAAAPAGLSALMAGLQRGADRARVTRQGVQGAVGGRLPLVKDATDLEMRVHRAVLPIPYICRDVEGQARGYLEAGRPLLLVGSSMVGKTRMAVNVIKGMYADCALVMPDTTGALASLDGADLELRDAVIFLDDVSRVIGADGITDGMLRRLATAGNVIVATIRAADYDRYQPTDQFRSPEWDVLSVFERVFLSRKLSGPEKDRLRDAVADREVRQRIAQTRLGEYVGAAEVIEETLRLGPSVSPGGYGLAKGAPPLG